MASLADHKKTIPGFTRIGAHAQETPAAATVIAKPSATIGGDRASLLLLQPNGASIRYTLDGTTPTAALGFLVADGDGITIPVTDGTTVTVIETAATAVVEYQWGR